MKLLKDYEEWSNWIQTDLDPDIDIIEKPVSFPCYLYMVVEDFIDMTEKAKYLYPDDIAKMSSDMPAPIQSGEIIEARIALTIDNERTWHAIGFSNGPGISTYGDCSDEVLRRYSYDGIEGDSRKEYWVTVEIEAPEVIEIEAKAKNAI